MLFLPLILTTQLKKTDYKTKINVIQQKTPDHSKYITTPEFNKLRAESFTERLAHTNQPLKVILLIS